MRKIRNYIKLVTKQITYVRNYYNRTGQRNGKETGQYKNYRLASEEQYFFFNN